MVTPSPAVSAHKGSSPHSAGVGKGKEVCLEALVRPSPGPISGPY